jgi:hypothetical protein
MVAARLVQIAVGWRAFGVVPTACSKEAPSYGSAKGTVAMSESIDAANDDRIRNAITLAKNMRNNGASLEKIEASLLRRGLDGSAVEAVLGHIPTEEPDNIIVRPDPSARGRKFLIVVGLTITALGFFFAIGNRTGLAPSVPFFGFATMIVGGALIVAGRRG